MSSNPALNIFISAGEASGDNIGQRLMQSILETYPQSHFFGLAGPGMIQLGAESYFDIKETAVVGFSSVIRKFPFFKRVLKTLKHQLLKQKVDIAIFIDYPGMNLRLYQFCQTQNIPTYYIAPPQMWVWKANRKKYFLGQNVLCTLKHEAELYKEWGIQADFIGHPLLDKPEDFPPIKRKKTNVISILPGSRISVVEENLPYFIEAKSIFESIRKHSFHWQLIYPEGFPIQNIENTLSKHNITATLNTPELFENTELCFCVPGTNNLELAIHGIPAFVLYKTSSLNKLIAKFYLKITKVSLVNILLNKSLYPEVIFSRFNSHSKQTLTNEISAWLNNENYIRNQLTHFKDHLGEKGFYKLAARRIGEIING